MRIVSLLPSATEIVCALGLEESLVGVTHECDWPPTVRAIPVVTQSALDRAGASSRRIHDQVSASIHGGSSIYELDDEALIDLAPDLILTQELCPVCAVSYTKVNEVVRRMDADVSVVSLEPTSIEGIFNAISTVGAMTEAEDAAVDVLGGLRERLGAVERTVAERRADGRAPSRAVALEWLDPPFAAGHWIPEQVQRAGGWELLGAAGQASRPTTWTDVAEVDPDMLFLMPCGFDLATTQAAWATTDLPTWFADVAAVRRGAVFALDGSAYFSRPGPRVIDGMEMLAEIIDPTAFVDIAPPDGWTPVGPA